MKPLLLQLTMALNMFAQPVPNNANWLNNPRFSNNTNTDFTKPIFSDYKDFIYRDWRESFRLGTDGEIILRNELFR